MDSSNRLDNGSVGELNLDVKVQVSSFTPAGFASLAAWLLLSGTKGSR